MTLLTPNGRPLLGIDPVQVPMSNSEMKTYKECKRKWWLSYYRGLQSKRRKMTGPLPLGTRVHAALEAYYTTPEGAVEAYMRFTELDRSNVLNDLDLKKFDSEAELGRIMVEGYIEWLEETGADAQIEVVSAEEKLSAEILGGRVEIRGKIDMRVRRKVDGVRLLMDHKALDVNHNVLTPSGYKRIGDVQVNDELIAPDGSTTHVTGVYPQGVVDLFKVRFSDKTEIRACAEHLWSVQNRKGELHVLTTKQVSESYMRHNQRQWAVPVVDGSKIVLEHSGERPVDPYVLGVLLGDGCRKTTNFVSWDSFIPDEVERRLYSNQRLSRRADGRTFSVNQKLERILDAKGRSYVRCGLKDWMVREGLWECYSYEKFVPQQYLHGTFNDRLALLQGLMDTDGNVRRATGGTLLITTSPRLRDATLWLVRSLGGVATWGGGRPGTIRDSDGVIHEHKPVYTINMRLPENACPFLLPRKVELWHATRSMNPRRLERMIYSIEPDGRGEAVCISVAHEDKLYVTDDFVVTHNTCQSFEQLTRTAHMDEQLMLYHMLELLKKDEPERCDGAVFNMLRKVKRGPSAKPPFYDRLEVHFNQKTMHAYWARLHGTVQDILDTRAQLDAGVDHHMVAYPSPTRDCTWKCEFFGACPMFDDGSAVEAFLDSAYQVGDPYERYENSKETD